MQVESGGASVRNLVVWFDIPVRNLGRSVKFYSEVLATELAVVEGAPSPQANFPFAPGIASGSLRENKEHKPGTTGTMVYLDGGDDLSGPLARVEAAGGTVIKGKTAIGPNGFMAIFKDCDGNLIALHSRN